MQAASEEERIVLKTIVEMVVYQLAQLDRDTGGGRGHIEELMPRVRGVAGMFIRVVGMSTAVFSKQRDDSGTRTGNDECGLRCEQS